MTNLFAFTGRITKDLEVKEVGNNTKVLNFSLAVDNPFKKDDVSFFDIVTFGNNAKNTALYCRKGSKVAVNGTAKQERFKDREGNNRSAVRFTAEHVEFLDAKEKTNETNNQPQQQAQPQQQTKSNGNPFANANGPIEISDDDLPF